MKQRALIALAFVAVVPILPWYVEQLAASVEGWWGLVPLVTVILFLWQMPSSAPQLTLPGVLFCIHVVGFLFLPPLASAVLAMTIVAAAASTIRRGTYLHLGAWGLLLLALPVLPFLRTHLSLSMQTTMAALATPLLRMTGLDVVRHGFILEWSDGGFSVDPSCSGLRKLLAGLYLACTVCCFQGLSSWRTGLALVLTIGVVLVGNTLRIVSLVYLYVADRPPGPWMHDAVGAVAFTLTALVIVLGVGKLAPRRGSPPPDVPVVC